MMRCFLVFLGIFLAACGTKRQTSTSGIDLAGMDKSVAPGDDFNAYTNGAWIKATPIPPDRSSYGIGVILTDETRKRTLGLIEDAANAGTAEGGKISDFYTTYMDENAIESKGFAPLKPELEAIAKIEDRPALVTALGSQIRADVDPLNNTNFETLNLFGLWIAQGLDDPSKSYPYVLQGGLGMPDRDYYLSDSPKMAEIRKKYQAHIEATLKLAGFGDAAARANRVFALETAMAKVHATRVESEDVHMPVKWTRTELAKSAPGLDWDALLSAAGLSDAPVLIAWQPKAISGLAMLVSKEPIDSWKDWLAFHAVEKAANFLPKAFVEEKFNFYGRTLSGIPELRPRWQRGIDFTNFALGDAIGKMYVQKYFPVATQARAQAMTADLIKAFAKRIDALDWMSPETKVKAKQKLETLKVGVGYGEVWRDYSNLKVVKGDALGNFERADLLEYHHQLAKLHLPVDRGEWWMTPQTVNAVNLPLQNALNFPAAILQPPYFDANADNAHNYGAIGAVIGHEISHSFDDQGSQFDASGRLANWWTKADFDHFREAGKALVAQFDAYRPFPDLAVNGQQTLSENIADLAGLLAAHDAYRISLGGKEDVVKDGFTGDQRFFISFGQSWRSKVRDEQLRRQIATDGHAPEQFRANTVRNLDPWYAAFSVQPSQKLFLAPDRRVRVW